MLTRIFSRSAWIITGVGVLFGSPLAVPTAKAQLEEVVVTARKREESLQDVPISVQALSGGELESQGLYDIGSLTPYVPNFHYVQAPGASDLLFMRGVGTYGSGVHFEPSVGQVFNGYFSTRSRLARTALIDVAQVEILKGPQGAIIGKNTSLGAINITSNRPTEEFEGRLSAALNADSGAGYELQGIISGPLSDGVRGRAVLDYQDIDGWIDNRTTGKSLQQKQDLTARVMLEVDFSDTATGEFLYQYNDLDRNGKSREVVQCLPLGTPSMGMGTTLFGANQGFDCTLNGSNQTGNVQRTTTDGTPFDPGEPYTTRADVLGATLTWSLDNFDIVSLSNYTTYDITDNFSGDLLATERANIQNSEDYSQFYQELRFVSTGDANYDWTAGLMYFTGELDFYQVFHATFAMVSRNEFAASETDSYAAFAQVDLNLSDELGLTLGGRFTDESRKGQKAQIPSPLYTLDTSPALCGGGFRACTNGDGSPIFGDLGDSGFSYNASLQWNPADESMLYGTVASGFKSGGFDLRGAGNPAKFVFGEEETTNVEVGGKHTLADGTLRFNWNLFHLEVDDLQVSTNDPVLIQQVVGAADVTSAGVEVDALWAATDAFNLSLAGALIDTTFDSFISNCHLGQTAAEGCMRGLFDQTGMNLPYAPEVQIVLGGDYTWPVGNGLEFTAAAKWNFLDDMHNTLPRDPAGFQDGSSRIDASLTLSRSGGSDRDWSVALVGRNLTDEKITMWCNSSTLPGSAVVSCALEELRYIALRGTIGF